MYSVLKYEYLTAMHRRNSPQSKARQLDQEEVRGYGTFLSYYRRERASVILGFSEEGVCLAFGNGERKNVALKLSPLVTLKSKNDLEVPKTTV